ncbi:MAG: SLBB domain-containing protein [Lentisphaeria bacterium]|nr:SLBB domain-containing protein [Lentisphaeria bacterium]
MKEDEDVKYSGEVGLEGLIEVPYLGKVSLVGLSEKEAEKKLKNSLEKELYVKATVSLTIIKRAPGHVYVYGAVKAPGKVDLPPDWNLTILQALSDAGGTTTWASPSDVYILRKNLDGSLKERLYIDVTKAFLDSGGAENIQLLSNDVIIVPSTTGSASVLSVESAEVIVTGQVETPGIITFAPGEQRSFLRAIFKAGNFTRFAKKDKVRLIRYQAGKTRKTIVVNAERMIDEGYLEDDFEVLPGDMIIVDEKRFNF